MDVTTITTRIVPQLHSDTVNNLAFWTACEITTWLDEAAKRLARTTGIFTVRDISTVLVEGQALYALPARHIRTLFVFHDNQPLIPTPIDKLELIDPGFKEIAKTPLRWCEDKEGIGDLRLWPAPDGDAAMKELAIIFVESRETLDCPGVTTTMVMPKPVEDYLETFALGKAWNKESDARLPEVGNHLAERARLMGQVIAQYWGIE